MKPPASNLPAAIARKLRAYELGRRRLSALRGAAESIMVFCAGLVCLVLLEAMFRPSQSWRILLSGGLYLLSAGWLVHRAGLPLLRWRNLKAVAWDFEAAAGNHFKERIVSAVELAESPPGDQPGVSDWMMRRTIQLAVEEIQAANERALMDNRPAVLAWKRAAGCLLVLAGSCLVPGLAPRFLLVLDPSAPATALSHIRLAVTPGNCRIRQGAPLEIRASGEELPEQAKAQIRWDDGFKEAVAMQRAGTNEFVLSLSSVTQGFRYSVQTGDAESAVFSVKVDVPPRIARLQWLLESPAYTRQTNRVVEGGNADFLAGSKLTLLIETADEKVVDAEWLSDESQLRKMKADGDRLVLKLQPTNPVSYQVRLTGANKLQSTSAQKWSLRPLPDQPPGAQLQAVGAEPGLVQRDEVLPLQARASDDVGLKRVDLVILSKDSKADVRILHQDGAGMPAREFRAPLAFNLADLDSLTGDEVQLQLVATDLRDQTTRSEPLAFTVGAADKVLAAQLAARLKLVVSAIAEQTEFLQQTRSSWLSISRNYRESDPSAQAPALTVLKSRLREFSFELDAIGQRLVGESETNDLPEARFLYRIGSTMSAWGAQQAQVLLSNCARVDQAAGTNVYESFNLGRELFSRAILDLEQYRHVVAVLQGALDTDVLATRCESAQSRYKRGLPVMRGDNIVAPLGQAGPGLMATFFGDPQLKGDVLERKVANPRFENYAPANRRENWSCRYEGEINIPESGDWTFACVSDDGVRLLVDGRPLLPQEAWNPHPPTQFTGDLTVDAGWHPVTVEFFQAGAGSKLEFLIAKKDQPLQNVPEYWLRPPAARQTTPVVATNALLNALVQTALRDRVRASLVLPAGVPAALAPLTNEVHNETLRRLIQDKYPVSEMLLTNLQSFASWTSEQSRDPEIKADDLTGTAGAANRIMHEELEKYRWRYEGTAALKEVQNAIQELRDITHELRRLPHNPKRTRSEEEQTEVQLAKAWQAELQRASAEAAHRFFEIAKEKESTLAQRATALAAADKTDQQLQPSVDKLAEVLERDGNKEEVAGRIEQHVNDIANRYRELNDLQEKIDREEIAARARQALPPARAFARAQEARDETNAGSSYQSMKPAVDDVLRALRVVGDYTEARKLQERAGETPEGANGRETARQVRELALRTDNNIPSLAQSIPPPMRAQTQSLEQHQTTQEDSANALARPRLGMSLESARLARQGDRRTAAAYGLLGQDLQALLNSPDQLAAATLQPLTDRAAALAGEKGEDARQEEIRAANERLRQMAARNPGNAEALAGRLEDASALARQAAGDAPKRQPLSSELAELSQLATPTVNWADSTDPSEIAASAASEAGSEILAGPKQWESYNAASEMLADAARQIRSDAAMADLAALNPFPLPAPAEAQAPTGPASPEAEGAHEGMTGNVIVQIPPKGLDQAEWARLTDRLRQAIRSSGIENFSPEHQAAIRAYFERLSADNQKASP